MTKQDRPYSQDYDHLEGTDKIRPWAYDTTNTLVWIGRETQLNPPTRIRTTIRVPRKENVPQKLSYVEFRIWIIRKCTEASIFRFKLTPFSRTYVDRREEVEPLHLVMSE